MDRDDFFSNVERFEREQHRQSRYEHSVVKKLMSWRGLNVAQLERDQRAANPDRPDFTTAWFNDNFPDFPINIGCQRVDYVHEDRLIFDLYKRPTKTRLVRAYNDWLDDLDLSPDETIVGFVFEFAGMGTQVMHNYPRIFETTLSKRPERNYALIRYLGTPPVCHYIEPLKQLLLSLGSQWGPQ